MAIDGISADILARELSTALKGARVERIHQPDAYLFVFQFYRRGRHEKLAISPNPGGPAIFPMGDAPPNPDRPPQFLMFLRKHLQGAILTDVTCPEYERMLVFHFETVSEIGDPEPRKMVVELMGRHSNLIVLNPDDIILDALVHVDEDMSRVREVMPARPYVAPPSQDKLAPEDLLALLNRGSLLELVKAPPLSLDDADPGPTLKQLILKLLRGCSPQLATHIVRSAALNETMTWGEVREDQAAVAALHDAWVRQLIAITRRDTSPCLIFKRASDLLPNHCHPYALDTLGPTEARPSYLQALADYYGRKSRLDHFKQRQHHILAPVERRLKRSLRRAEHLRNDLKETEEAPTYQRYGELLLANLHQLTGKSPEARVTDYYDPEQRTCVIPLDPKYGITDNAERYFKQANRLKKAHKVLIPQIREEEQNAEYLRSLLNLIHTAESERELEEVRREIEASPLFDTKRPSSRKKPSPTRTMPAGKPASRSRARQRAKKAASKRAKARQAKAKGSKQPRALPPRRYLSSDGLTILAGRSNTQNDQLTMRTAQKDDLWFHVQHEAGTHVILRREDRAEIPEQSILEAAAVAAWFSRGNRNRQEALQATMAVDYCPVAHVRKPRGARPGFVIYEGHQTLFVRAIDPDASLTSP